jgi:hypothetical protein
MNATVALPSPITGNGSTGPLTPNDNTVPQLIMVDVTSVSPGASVTFAARRAEPGADWPAGEWSTAAVTTDTLTAPGQLQLELPALITPRGGSRHYRLEWTVTGTEPQVTASASAAHG